MAPHESEPKNPSVIEINMQAYENTKHPEPKKPTCTQICDGASSDGLYTADNQFVLMLLFGMVLYVVCMVIIWLWLMILGDAP